MTHSIALASQPKRTDLRRRRARADRAHDRSVQRKYGLQPGQYTQMLTDQGGRCALCRRRSRKRLAVDHSHTTGTVRGLLCDACNRYIVASLDNDLPRIQAAIDFLRSMQHDLTHHHQALTPVSPTQLEANHQTRPRPLRLSPRP